MATLGKKRQIDLLNRLNKSINFVLPTYYHVKCFFMKIPIQAYWLFEVMIKTVMNSLNLNGFL
jgi:hypothetical protein